MKRHLMVLNGLCVLALLAGCAEMGGDVIFRRAALVNDSRDGGTGPAPGTSTLPEPPEPATLLFSENFEDADLGSRGWYDSTSVTLSTVEHVPGSTRSAQFTFNEGASVPAATSGNQGTLRRKFTPSDSVYLRYYVKYSSNWTGSNQGFHPHEFMFLTDASSDYQGPAYSRLTLYVEQNEGTPVLLAQDSINIDTGRINHDLTAATENRSVAGCNGVSFETSFVDCYFTGSQWRNGVGWRASQQYFSDSAGPHYKADWHLIEAYFKLNSVRDGRGIGDGVAQYWYDGELIIDRRDVIFRTAQNADMKLNQFIVAPYIGSGSPVTQTMWVDDLVLATGRGTHDAGSTSWTNEPAGMTLISDQGFDSLATGTLTDGASYEGWRYQRNHAHARIAPDSSSLAGGNVLEFVYPAGFAGGAGPASWRPPSPLPDSSGARQWKEIFLGFHFRGSPGWQFHGSNVNKIAFFWRNNTASAYLDWNNWSGLSASPSFILRNSVDGSPFYPPNQPGAVPIQPGQWYKVEIHLRLESVAGASDGLFRVWIDDVLQSDHPAIPNLSGYISNVYFDPVWGGVGDVKAQDDSIRIDQVRVSVK